MRFLVKQSNWINCVCHNPILQFYFKFDLFLTNESWLNPNEDNAEIPTYVEEF